MTKIEPLNIHERQKSLQLLAAVVVSVFYNFSISLTFSRSVNVLMEKFSRGSERE
jgi:hypothetical protein